MININENETTIVPNIINEPIKECTLELFNHFGRYYLASKKLNLTTSDSLIDGSCGCGYGSYSLSQKVDKVFGLDINENNLDIAKKYYSSNSIVYSTYKDFFKTDIFVDKIISLETFEHVPKEDICLFINNLVSHLKSKGSMFFSVPLGNNEPSSYNQWHCNEPSIDFIQNLFSKYFSKIEIEIDSFINSFGYECQYCFLTLLDKRS